MLVKVVINLLPQGIEQELDALAASQFCCGNEVAVTGP